MTEVFYSLPHIYRSFQIVSNKKLLLVPRQWSLHPATSACWGCLSITNRRQHRRTSPDREFTVRAHTHIHTHTHTAEEDTTGADQTTLIQTYSRIMRYSYWSVDAETIRSMCRLSCEPDLRNKVISNSKIQIGPLVLVWSTSCVEAFCFLLRDSWVKSKVFISVDILLEKRTFY